MSENEDKAKKLKEIQERLAEIQKGSAKKADPKPGPTESNKVTKPVSNDPKIIETKPEVNPEVKNNQKETKPLASKKTEPKANVLSQEEKNWKENRLREQSQKKSGKKKLSASKIYTALSLIITFGICSYFAYTFYIHSGHDNVELIQTEIPQSNLNEISDSEPSSDISDFENISSPIQNDQVKQEAEKPPKESDIKIANKKEVIVRKDMIQKEDDVKYNEVIAKTPAGIIISYVSNSSEEMAKSNVKKLAEKGFKANYYYMPDKSKNSPALYKVYLGPYKDESAAMSDFRRIVELNDKAFILRLD